MGIRSGRLPKSFKGNGTVRSFRYHCSTKPPCVSIYQQRFPTATLPTRLPEALHRNTEGSPLFVTAVVDELLDRGVITRSGGVLGIAGAGGRCRHRGAGEYSAAPHPTD